MDIGKSISFVFEDEKWLEKVLIGGLITLGTILLSWTVIGAVVGGALITGYAVELLRNVRRHEQTPLPVWDNWGDKIVLGVKLVILYIIWALPLIVVWIPAGILAAIFGETNSGGGVISAMFTCLSCLSAIYGILLALAAPGITIHFAESGQISSGLEFRKILAFTRENIGDVIIALLVAWAVSLFASVVGLVLCGIGLLFTAFWATLVQYHLFAQIGLRGAAAGAFGSGHALDLSPDDVMPGVGELPDEPEDRPSSSF